MTFLDTAFGLRALTWPRLMLLGITVLSGAAAIGLVASQQPLLAVVAVLAIPLALTVMTRPDAATLAVVFILYSNAAVIAVQFHGVPYFIGASFSMLLVIPLAYYLIVRGEKLIINPALPLVVLFVSIEVIGTLFSADISISMETVTASVLEGAALYFLITNVIRTPELLRRVIWVLLIAGSFMGGLSFYQQVTGTYNNDYGGFARVSNASFGTGVETLQGEVEQRRLSGPIGEQNRYAQVMLMLVPLALFRFWGERSNWLRIAAAIAAGLISLGVALTFSRGAAVGFLLMLVIMTFLRYIKLYQIVIIVLGLVLLFQAVPEYRARLSTLEELTDLVTGDSGIAGADRVVQSRTTEMLAAILVFADHPIIGAGPGMFPYYYRDYAELVGIKRLLTNRNAHNLYLGLAAEDGALGLLCFLAILFVTLRNLNRTRKHWMQRRPDLANMATSFMVSIVTFMTTGLFLHFAYVRYFWLMLALAGVAGYLGSRGATETEQDDAGMGYAMPAVAQANSHQMTRNGRSALRAREWQS